MPISWFTDYRYGMARRRLAATVLLALVFIVGAATVLFLKMSSLPKEENRKAILAEDPHPQPRISLSLGEGSKNIKTVSPPAQDAPQESLSGKTTEDLHSAYEDLSSLLKEEGATACLEKIEGILKDHPHLSPDILNLQAVAYSNLSAWPQAEAALRKALDQEPDNTRYLMNLAIIAQRMGNYAESLKRLRQMESLGQGTSLIRTKIMLVRIQGGEAEAVRRELRMQAEAAPLATGLRAPIVSAALALEKGDTKNAQRCLSQAAQLADEQTLQSYLSDPFFIRYSNSPALFPYLLRGDATNSH